MLLQKLNTCGIRGVAKDWISSDLTNRMQDVTYDNHSSQLLDVIFGWLQGSTLGPLLFILYINAIAYAPQMVNVCSDDRTLYLSQAVVISLFTNANFHMKTFKNGWVPKY